MRLIYCVLLLVCTSCFYRQIPDQVSQIYRREMPGILAPQKEQLIVIDAGHGGRDTGSASKLEDYEEKTLTLETALRVNGFLKELGYKTILTRHNDTYVPLTTRSEIANSVKADLFVSIHYNYCPSREARGVEIFFYKEIPPRSKRVQESRMLGEQVSSHIVKYTGMHTRGLKEGNLAVIRETEMPAILIEAGFLSNPTERAKLKDPQHQKALAWGIAKGIDHYLNIP
ncbi:MAG: N-acetylmuramoyl-L-alanine amidase [Chlamydiales bacterium]